MCRALYRVITRTMPMPVATKDGTGSIKSTMATKAPNNTPTIWARQESQDSLKVGCTAAMAPSMAKISLEALVPR